MVEIILDNSQGTSKFFSSSNQSGKTYKALRITREILEIL